MVDDHTSYRWGKVIVATLRQGVLAEFIGSMFLVVAAIASAILPFNVLDAGLALSILMNAIAVALVLFALIETLSPISGAHFNPAVTLAFLLTHDIDKKKAAAYIPAQFAGGFIGVIATHLMFFDIRPDLLVVSGNFKTPALYFAEFLGTFILLGVIYGCVRGRSKHTSLSIGAVVGGMLITTSSTMYANPVVTFARMFTYAICGIAPQSALFFISAEVLGSVVAARTFGYLFPTRITRAIEQSQSVRSEPKVTD